MAVKQIFLDEVDEYLDEDLLNIVFTDLTLEGKKIETKKNIKRLEDRIKTINICKLPNYLVGSVGYTSKELKENNIDFESIKILTNDYNSTLANNEIIYSKLLYKDNKVLGLQIANLSNIEKRLDAVLSVLDDENGLKKLMSYKVYKTTDEFNPDVVNLLAFTAIGKKDNSMKEVDSTEVFELYNKKAFFLDVRENYEYDEGHIKGAVNIPLRELLMRKDELPKDKNIYVYCRTAHRSADGVSFLNTLGFENVYNVLGGFIDISFIEFKRDAGNLKNSILTNYNFR